MTTYNKAKLTKSETLIIVIFNGFRNAYSKRQRVNISYKIIIFKAKIHV